MNTGEAVGNIALTAKKWGCNLVARSSTMSTGLLSLINVSEATYVLKIICTCLLFSECLHPFKSRLN